MGPVRDCIKTRSPAPGNFLFKSSEVFKAARYLVIQCIRSPQDERRFPSPSTLGKRNLACSLVGDKATTFGIR